MEFIASLATPLPMLVIGYQLYRTDLRRVLKSVNTWLSLVMRLVVTYRLCSIDPTAGNYVIEILALVFLTMGFFRLSAFAFGESKPRSFIFCAVMATVFALASAADFGTHIFALSSLLLYVGSGLALLGFLLLYLNGARNTPSED